MLQQNDDWLDRRRQQQRERGICSEPDCDDPIFGWCDTCDKDGPFKAPKLCGGHLIEHLRQYPDHAIFMPYARNRGGVA